MPTIEISRRDLQKLVRKKLDVKEAASYIKAEIEVDEKNKDLLHVELKDINRPDLWSVEGIARELKYKFGFKINYDIIKAKRESVVKVKNKVKKVRPLIACAIVKNLKLTEEAIKQIIQLQEKLCESFGLKRKEAALGIYDFDKIKWPIIYTSYKPESIKFVPIGSTQKLNLREILKKHEKGQQYGNLISEYREWPILIDSAKNVLSMPPIINSDYSGRITGKTKNLFIEVTGFSDRFVLLVLNIMVAALAERGGRVEKVRIKQRFKKRETPDLTQSEFKIKTEEINEILGLNLDLQKITTLLNKSGLSIKKKDKKEITILIPVWRQDIMDVRDVAEDIAIVYGYNKFKPEMPHIYSLGIINKKNLLARKIKDILVGLESQEIATFIFTNKELLFKKMKQKAKEIIEIKNPISSHYTCLRNWVLPSILEWLSINKNARYPQKLFEISKTISVENNKAVEKEKLCYVISNTKVDFTDIRQVLDWLLTSLNLKYELEPTKHETFIEGRSGKIKIKKEIIEGRKIKHEIYDIGIIGEIKPNILDKFNLMMPTVAFEIDLENIYPK